MPTRLKIKLIKDFVKTELVKKRDGVYIYSKVLCKKGDILLLSIKRANQMVREGYAVYIKN